MWQMIDREKVYTYFNKFHGPVTPSTNGWYSTRCPICGKEKFAVHFDYLIGKCWRGCFKGFLLDVISLYHGINYFETREIIDSMEPGLMRLPASLAKGKSSDMILPSGYMPILSGNEVIGNRARTYLEGRGFDLNYLDRIGVGYGSEKAPEEEDYFGYIIIPFKKRGLLVYFIGRDFIGNFPRYKNPPKEKYGIGKMEVFFNEEALFLQDKIYLTEGWACAATMGNNGVSQQGSTPSTIQKNTIIKSDVKEVIIVPDAGFYHCGLEAARDLIGYKKVKVLCLDAFQQAGLGKDINDIGKGLIQDKELETPYLTMGLLYKQLKEVNA
jgi:hypothetical protein